MQSRTRLGHLLLRKQRARWCSPNFGSQVYSHRSRKGGHSSNGSKIGLPLALKQARRAPESGHLPSSLQPSALISGGASQSVVLQDGDKLCLSKKMSPNDVASGSDLTGGLLHATGSSKPSSNSTKTWSFFRGAGAAAVVLLTAAVVASAESENGYMPQGDELRVWLWSLKASVVDNIEVLKGRLVLGMRGMFEAGSATLILVQFLAAVLFHTNDPATDGLSAWWRPKVACLIADVAAHENRRKAVVDAGNGSVVDWLLHGVAESSSVQNEAARALAYLLSDARTSETVLGRPQAMPHLLRFAASLHAETDTKHGGKSDFGHTNNELSRGRSMLVAAVMDIVTSSCDVGGRPSLKLPVNADRKDMEAVLRVLCEGCPLLYDDNRDDVYHSTKFPDKQPVSTVRDQSWSRKGHRHGSSMKFGLWDDLKGPQVCVPLAAWALAAWAQSSNSNCAKIADLDKRGEGLLAALQASERTVKWHTALTINSLLNSEDRCLSTVAHVFTEALLFMAAQAGRLQDTALAKAAMDALCASVGCNTKVHSIVLERGLPVMREIAKHTSSRSPVQVPLARTLDLLVCSESGLPLDECKKWSGIVLLWVGSPDSERTTRTAASRILSRVVDALGPSGIPISQAWLAMLLMDLVADRKKGDLDIKSKAPKEEKTIGIIQSQVTQAATVAATHLAKLVAQEAAATQVSAEISNAERDPPSELPVADLLGLDALSSSTTKIAPVPRVTYVEAASAVLKGVKALTELSAENPAYQLRITELGGLYLIRKFLLGDDYDKWAAVEVDHSAQPPTVAGHDASDATKNQAKGTDKPVVKLPSTARMRKQAARLLSILSLRIEAAGVIASDEDLCSWLEQCADGGIVGNGDLKIQSYARTVLLNVLNVNTLVKSSSPITDQDVDFSQVEGGERNPRFEDMVYLMNPDSIHWKSQCSRGCSRTTIGSFSSPGVSGSPDPSEVTPNSKLVGCEEQPLLDVVFVHGLCGGPFKTWRVSDDKTSTTDKSGLVESIDKEAGKDGTCWPREWLSHDLPHSRLFTLKYKTNLSQWSGATLPLQEVSSMLLDKLLAAGVGERPTVFVTHSMGGLVVKQMLLQAGQDKTRAHLVHQTRGIVFYSCPHFGSKLADMPWRMGYVLRPAPSIGELRSGSPRLEELNRCIRVLHSKNNLEVLNFSETKVTPLVEGYGGLALRMEVVPIESAFPGYGELVVLDGTDHVNSCKPLSRSDPAYTKTLEFLQRVEVLSRKVC